MRAIYLDGTPVGDFVEPGRAFRIHVPYHECLNFATQPHLASPSIFGGQFVYALRVPDPALSDPRYIVPDPNFAPPSTIADELVTDPIVMVWEDQSGLARAGYAFARPA